LKAPLISPALVTPNLGTPSAGVMTNMTGAVTASLVDDAVTGAKIENNPTIAGNLTVSGDLVPSTPLSHRNMIINGAMNVSQRSSVAFAHDGTTAGYSEVDRYKLDTNVLSEWDGTMTQHTMTQAELNTTGFGKALKLATGTAESAIGASDLLYINHRIEAQNLQHLQYGTAAAKTVTLSFWVKTSVTGTYAVGLYKPDATGRNVTATYTTTGTGWEYKTLTFAGDTDATATIANDNGTGFYVTWHLASGSNYDSSPNTSWGNYASANWAGGHAQDGIVTTASATFYITGVQLELGSSATPFEHRSYGEELLRCQRYYQKQGGDANMALTSGASTSSSSTFTQGNLVCPMRGAIAMTFSTLWLYGSQNSNLASAALDYYHSSSTCIGINASSASTPFDRVGEAQMILTNSDAGYMAFDSEI